MFQRPTRRGHRHTARARGYAGIPASRYITPPPAQHDTAPLFLPLRPALGS